MKKLALLLIGGAAFGWTGVASAADVPISPVYKAAAPAPQVVSGYLGLYAGGSWWKTNEYDEDGSKGRPFVFGGEGRLNYWLSPSSSVQVDAEAEASTKIKETGDGRIHGVIAAHYAAMRDPSSASWGVFGNLIGANNTYSLGQDTYWLLGLEAQRYIGNITLYGQAGYLGSVSLASCGSDGCGEPNHAWFLRGIGRLFPDPNTKLQAEVGYAKTDPRTGGDSSARIWNWGVSAERMISGPWSGFIEYAGYNYKGNTAGATTEHIFLAGVKLNVNIPSLQWADRNGATYDNPKFIRALPSSCAATTC
jgi:hypothetical protein